MPTAEQIQRAIRNVTDQRSFADELLRNTLNWPINLDFEDIDDITYEWTDDELNTVGLSRDVLAGPVLQMQSLEQDNEQPWGIFILEFANIAPLVTGRGLTGPLRKVLRGLVPKRRRQANLPAWDRENLLFICTHQYQHFRFAYFKSPKEKGHAEPLTTFGWEPGLPPRTVCEFNLGHLCWPEDSSEAEKWVTEWAKAFDVETVTKKFYEDYEQVFTDLQSQLDLAEVEDKKMFAQLLMNRLMFLRFVERKGWLRLISAQQGPQNYLQKLFEAGPVGDSSWYNSRLKVLFFEGMAILGSQQSDIIGQVPYLNGGLFEKNRLDDLVTDVPNEAFISILGQDGLFYRYNFTIEESTPLDIDVAVDPEMLGKVFEKLVTARRQQGSYYTPRTVVSFMCRETLKGYLGSYYAPLIDEGTVERIGIPEARDLLGRLANVKVVDPACGSGAYLLGMLQELFRITKLLDTRAETETPHDAYQRKLTIIQNNLYGVDIDEFAINIARLRLWLSLAVEFEGNEPEPLPNLDFKIECGDTLTVPDPSGGIEPGLHRELMRRYVTLRRQYLNPPPDIDKNALLRIISELKEDIVEWLHSSGPVEGFDWQVEFIEVFINGGFDIVLANPPYGVRVETAVRNQYFNQRSENEKGQSRDSYGFFMVRGLQLLRLKGTLSYIVSDTWRTIKSHRPLRKRLLDNTIVFHVLDLPSWIFDATVNTGIITLQKEKVPEDHQLIAADLRGIEKENWKSLSDNLIAVSGHGPDIQTMTCARYTYAQAVITTCDNLSFFIGSPELYEHISKSQFTSLGQIADVKYGIRTGDNRQFLFKSSDARGSYNIADVTKVLTPDEVSSLSREEKLNGFLPTRFNGKYLVPLDRGQASDAEGGLLPNYSTTTDYFINWSRESVDKIKELRGMRNPEYYFMKGISFSWTGYYAPTFRENSTSVFDQSSSCVFFENVSLGTGLAILCSKYIRYAAKCLINHTVNSDVNTIRTLPMLRSIDDYAEQTKILEYLVAEIMKKQKTDVQYPYHLHEQKEIEQLVYGLYGLGEDDIREVELWYCRRYPKLSEAQGVVAEVKGKYANHLARCQRILEKPPSYWRSNPILELIAQGEGHTLEFKETLEYSVDTRQRSPNVLKSSLKTIAGFLNADGGTLLIGISNSGEVKGLQKDFRCMGRIDRDRFELHIRNYLRDRFAPSPIGKVNISFQELSEGMVCRVDVQPSEGIIHLDDEVYVRDGNKTQKLEGRALTDWFRQRTD